MHMQFLSLYIHSFNMSDMHAYCISTFLEQIMAKHIHYLSAWKILFERDSIGLLAYLPMSSSSNVSLGALTMHSKLQSFSNHCKDHWDII